MDSKHNIWEIRQQISGKCSKRNQEAHSCIQLQLGSFLMKRSGLWLVIYVYGSAKQLKATGSPKLHQKLLATLGEAPVVSGMQWGSHSALICQLMVIPAFYALGCQKSKANCQNSDNTRLKGTKWKWEHAQFGSESWNNGRQETSPPLQQQQPQQQQQLTNLGWHLFCNTCISFCLF